MVLMEVNGGIFVHVGVKKEYLALQKQNNAVKSVLLLMVVQNFNHHQCPIHILFSISSFIVISAMYSDTVQSEMRQHSSFLENKLFESLPKYI